MLVLPLFPLHSVLFPAGDLHLRVFEQRYLDLVRDCSRADAPFGVCQIIAGHEVGDPALPAAFGCSARIVDFHVDAQGLLGIVARGEQRFHVHRLRVRDNGALLAEVELLAESPQPLRPEHGLLSSLLEKMLERANSAHARADQACFDDAHWIGYRLAELLPLAPADRQGLLQCADPHERLQRMLTWLPQLAEG